MKKVTILLIVAGFTIISFAVKQKPVEVNRIGNTRLNGNGCVCHSFYEDTTVHVWIEGPAVVNAGSKATYKMRMTGGPSWMYNLPFISKMKAGGYNTAVRFGMLAAIDSLSKWDKRAPNELTQAMPLQFSSPFDTLSWSFDYIAPDSVEWDTVYSTGLILVWDNRPDSLDRWGFGPNYPVRINHQSRTINSGFTQSKAESGDMQPSSFALQQNYPNPFNPSTKIRYNIPASQQEVPVKLTVYSISGSEVAVLVNERKPSGTYEVIFDAASAGGTLSSGVYIYKLTAGNFTSTKKMVMMK